MNVPTIEVDRQEAREAYLEYLHAWKEEQDDRTRENYAALKNAYREVSKGGRVVSVREAIRQGGCDAKGRPYLAVCRADARLCFCRVSTIAEYPNGQRVTRLLELRFSTNGHRWDDSLRKKQRHVERFDAKTLPGLDFRSIASNELRAVVPAVPPALRPKGQLSRYLILWEADWEEIPVDPVLLRPLGGGLALVVAEWDLTDLEREVLHDRSLLAN